jgi:predicted ATP-grasp superfamily ATP-dependent carboligase
VKILLVGVSTRSIAESAVRSGYEITAIDAFGDYDLKALCESYSLRRDFQIPFSASGLFTASRQLSFDAVAYTSNLENHPEVVQRFARHAKVLGNTAEVLRSVRTWSSLSDVLNRSGCRVPEAIYHSNGRRIDPERQWLRKPLNSGGGHGIVFALGARSAGRGYLLQEYIPGLSCSASFVANQRDAVVIGLAEQLIGRTEFGANGFRYCGNILPLETARNRYAGTKILEQVQRIATLITREFGLAGVNGFDFILADDQVCLIEVNPRYSASMELIEKAYGLPIFDLHVQAIMQGRLPDFDLDHRMRQFEQRSYGKAILYAEKEGLAPDTQDWVQSELRDVPFPGESLAEGKPICTILAAGESQADCLARLIHRAQAIKGEIYA